MTMLKRYDRVGGITIGKVELKIKAEGVGVTDEVADNTTASTSEMTVLDLDEDGDLSDNEEVKE